MTTIQVGSIVAFHYNDVLQAGIVTNVEATTISIITQSSQELSLPYNRFTLRTSQPWDKTGSPSTSSLIGFISAFETRMDKLTDNDITQGILSAERPISWDHYSSLVCKDDPIELFARFFHIRTHPELYIWKKDTIRLRTAEERDDYAAKLVMMQERADFLAAVSPLISSSDPDQSTKCLSPAQRDRLVSELRYLLQGGDLPDLHRLISQSEPILTIPEKVNRLRIMLGDIDSTTDPIISRSGLPVSFPSALDKELADPDISLCTKDYVFSVDELDGSDFDDALSFSETDEGYCFGVHISAVSAYIPLNSSLFAEANKRISSMYLTNETIPLFPEELSHHDLSLIAGKTRATLSLMIETDREYCILRHHFRLQHTMISANLSYREVDNRIQESPFIEMHRFTSSLSRERLRNSAPKQDRDVYYYLRFSDSKLTMRKVNPNSPARIMIEEMMVLYNRLFAETALNAKTPMLFRNISRIVTDDEQESLAASQAYLSTDPQFHPGIGASAYVHASSPIRRFTDLVNQYQMLSLIQGTPTAFSEQSLQSMIPSIEEVIRHQREVIMKSERYWFLRFLSQSHLNTPLSAESIKHNKQGLVVEIQPWQKRLILVGSGYAPAGRDIQIVVHKTDPLKGLAFGDVIC